MANDALGQRIKANYEGPARHSLLRRTPVIVRLDGRAFHTFTRRLEKPFDARLHTAMCQAAICLGQDMQGCKLAYVQSDEASFLLTDYDTLETQPWFGYDQSKVESISASVMTGAFARKCQRYGIVDRATFDSRAFNIPREEVANYFLWRAKDWYRNSVQMLARTHFSHNELHGKKIPALHEMLHSIGINWANLVGWHKNGTWINFALPEGDGQWQTSSCVRPRYAEIASLPPIKLAVGTDQQEESDE